MAALQTRFQMTRMGAVPELLAHLDLLHPARQIWRLRLPSVALTQLERHILQFDRGEDIPSATIPQRYFDFLRGGSPEAMVEVFHHNQMDLCGLASLALRIAGLLADPESSGCGAGELFGISRLLQRRGQDLSPDAVSESLGRGVAWNCGAGGEERTGLHGEARTKLCAFKLAVGKASRRFGGRAEAYEQLAIYYEHHASLPQKAAALSREALVRLQESFRAGRLPVHKYQQWHASFQHRLTRLAAKTAK